MIDSTLAAFMRGPVTFVLGARNRDNLASVVYGKGCRIDAAANTITVLVSQTQAAELLDDLRAFPSVALIVCRPTTLRTLQLKGTDARIAPIIDGDAARATAYLEMMIEELAQVGDESDWTRVAFSLDVNDLVAVTFTPQSVFNQTPGPEAGAQVGAEGAR